MSRIRSCGCGSPFARLGLLAGLGLALLGMAGCDKCGNRVNINVPSLQHACGDNAQPSR